MNKIELNDSQKINDALYNFCQTLFKEKAIYIRRIYTVSFPEQNENQTLKCEGAITESELLKASSSMNNDKSPINKRNKRISRKLFGMLLKNHFALLFNSLS